MFFWLSWYEESEDYRPLNYPPNEKVLGWWCSGVRDDDAATICAMVEAATEEEAKAAIGIDWPGEKEWRFCNESNLALGDRFPLDSDWAKERFEKARESHLTINTDLFLCRRYPNTVENIFLPVDETERTPDGITQEAATRLKALDRLFGDDPTGNVGRALREALPNLFPEKEKRNEELHTKSD